LPVEGIITHWLLSNKKKRLEITDSLSVFPEELQEEFPAEAAMKQQKRAGSQLIDISENSDAVSIT
jgi:hypothetical protein